MTNVRSGDNEFDRTHFVGDDCVPAHREPVAVLTREEARRRLIEQVASWSASPCSCDVLVDNLIGHHADEWLVALGLLRDGFMDPRRMVRKADVLAVCDEVHAISMSDELLGACLRLRSAADEWEA